MSKLKVINALLNTDSSYEDKRKQAEKLANKWAKTKLLEGLNDADRLNMAILLENQAKELIKEASSTGQTPGSEEWSGIALPLVRKVFGNIPAKDFVSVQPMDKPSGLVFYLDFKYGNNKASFSKGGSLYGTTQGVTTPTGGYYGEGRFSYSMREFKETGVAITVAAAAAVDFNYDSRYTPADYQKLTITVNSAWEMDLEAVRSTLISSAKITQVLNAFTKHNTTTITYIVKNAGAAITNADTVDLYYTKQPTSSHRGDFEYRDGMTVGSSDNQYNIPEIDIQFNSESVVAKTRRLKATWTPEVAQDLNAYHAIDAEQEVTNILSQNITTEIDLEILDMLLENVDSVDYWSARVGYEFDPATHAFAKNDSYYINNKPQWFATISHKIQKVSNMIHMKTMRGGANFAVVSPEIATVLQGIPGYMTDYNGNNDAKFNFGVQKMGSFNNQITVYKNPYMTGNVMLLGYRGNTFLETGAVFAPYIPLIMTPLIYDPNTLTPRKGVMTRYAKKMIRNEFFGAVVVDGLQYV